MATFFTIKVKDSDAPKQVIKTIKTKYANELLNGKMITGTKIIKTTEYPTNEDENAHAAPNYETHNIYVKVKKKEIIYYQYHNNFKDIKGGLF